MLYHSENSLFLKDLQCLLTGNPIQDGLFRGSAHGWEGGQTGPPSLFNCRTYPTMMKLDTVLPYLKKVLKKYKTCDTPLEFC